MGEGNDTHVYTPHQRAVGHSFLSLPYPAHMLMPGHIDLRVIVKNSLPSFLQIVSLCSRINPIETSKEGASTHHTLEMQDLETAL